MTHVRATPKMLIQQKTIFQGLPKIHTRQSLSNQSIKSSEFYFRDKISKDHHNLSNRETITNLFQEDVDFCNQRISELISMRNSNSLALRPTILSLGSINLLSDSSLSCESLKSNNNRLHDCCGISYCSSEDLGNLENDQMKVNQEQGNSDFGRCQLQTNMTVQSHQDYIDTMNTEMQAEIEREIENEYDQNLLEDLEFENFFEDDLQNHENDDGGSDTGNGSDPEPNDTANYQNEFAENNILGNLANAEAISLFEEEDDGDDDEDEEEDNEEDEAEENRHHDLLAEILDEEEDNMLAVRLV